ncbi:MAG: pyridoxamine 5'-phosphate oxidase [Mesorhizobium amorphae]|nr:MAG: pyridoxamine 5'-phosphate oxidase [Mesorhizobium amorphae]
MAEAERKVLQDVDETAIRLARMLLRSARFGALAVNEPRTGFPLASRVGVATDPSGVPLILVSGLSAHTRALKADGRVSLLVGEPGKGDPLAHPRITLVCRAEVLERGTTPYERAERRYLNRHPKAQLYAGLGDFTMVRLVPERASLNGGFGRAYEMTAGDLLIPPGPAVDALANMEDGAIRHMNADHRDAVALYATELAKQEPGAWTITGLDLDGMDLALGDKAARVFFAEPLRLADDLRRVLAGMAREARGL